MNQIKNGPLFRNKLVLMVTYDLDQAEQMDWVLHLNDDGSLAASESSETFFKSTNIESLKNNLILVNDEKESNGPPDQSSQAKGIISEEEQETNLIKADYGVILDYFGFADKKFGGRLSFLTIIGLHILINIATSSLSFYLAVTLSDLSTG